jgi:hypothetical protein
MAVKEHDSVLLIYDRESRRVVEMPNQWLARSGRGSEQTEQTPHREFVDLENFTFQHLVNETYAA